MNSPILEVCSGSLASALAAQEGGAFRIELCDNLYEGGTTPSMGTIEMARQKLSIRLHVIVRPRGGDFLYSDLEYEVIRRDIERCKEAGADGVVIGFLQPDGTIDVARTKEIVELATPMSVTFHRAFDMTPDAFDALEDLKTTGVHRILTSGQKNSVTKSIPMLQQLVQQAGDSIIIMPGAGLDENNIRDFSNQVKAREYHATLRVPVDSRMLFRRDQVYMGGLSEIPEFSIKQTDAARVRQFVNMLIC